MRVGKKYLIWIIVLSFFTGSCSIFKAVEGGKATEVNIKEEYINHLKISAARKYILCDNGSISVEAEKKMNAKFVLFAEKNELIFTSIRYMGFEIARIGITKDSIKYINRLEKEYLFESLEKMNSFSGIIINFDLLENLLFHGMIEDGNKFYKEIIKSSIVKDDTLVYKKNINGLSDLNASYIFPGFFLAGLEFRDVVEGSRAVLNIERSGEEIKSIYGQIQKELFLADYSVSLSDISEKYYSKTDFNVGKNYRKTQKLF